MWLGLVLKHFPTSAAARSLKHHVDVYTSCAGDLDRLEMEVFGPSAAEAEELHRNCTGVSTRTRERRAVKLGSTANQLTRAQLMRLTEASLIQKTKPRLLIWE